MTHASPDAGETWEVNWTMSFTKYPRPGHSSQDVADVMQESKKSNRTIAHGRRAWLGG